MSESDDLDIVSKALRIQKEDILAYGFVRLYVCYMDTAEKNWKDTNIVGTATIHLPKNLLNVMSLYITSVDTRQVVFRCRGLHGWQQQSEYWYSFDMISEPNCNYLAGISFSKEEDGRRFHNIVVDLTQNFQHYGQNITRVIPESSTKQKRRSKLKNKISSMFHTRDERVVQPSMQSYQIRSVTTQSSKPITRIAYGKEGFNYEELPASWKKIFAEAGISETELRDPKTARFLMKSINVLSQQKAEERKNGGRNVIVRKTAPSKTTSVTTTTRTTAANSSRSPSVMESQLLDLSVPVDTSNINQCVSEFQTDQSVLMPQNYYYTEKYQEEANNPFDESPTAYGNSNYINNEIYGTSSYSSYDEAYFSRYMKNRPESHFNPNDYIETDEMVARKLQDEYNKEVEYIEQDEVLAKKLQSESEANTNYTQNDQLYCQSTYNMNAPKEFSEDTTFQPHRYVSYESEPPVEAPVRNNISNVYPFQQYYPISAEKNGSFEEHEQHEQQHVKRNISSPQISEPPTTVSEPKRHEVNPVPITGVNRLPSQPFAQQHIARTLLTAPRQATVEQKPITPTQQQQPAQKLPQVPATSESTRTSKALENAPVQVQPQSNAPPPPPPPISSGKIRTTAISKNIPAQSLSEAISNAKLRPVPKAPEGAANTGSPKNRIPTSELLREIKQCKLRHAAQSIPADLDEEDAGEFAATLSHLIKERRTAISGGHSEEEESSEGQEW